MSTVKINLITSQKSEFSQYNEVLSVTENDSQVKKQLNKSFDDFIEIIEIYQTTVENNETISKKIYKIKEKYNDLIKTNTNKVFLFCLNSLYFQFKILNFELENFTKMNSLIQNRMYGDYYKLYNIIISQCKENNIIFTEENFAKSLQLIDNDNKNSSTETDFPVYKDIDPFFRYRIEDIILLHQRILIIIDKLDDIYIQKESKINEHKENIRVGFSLSIFLNTLEYENELLKGQIKLYMEYISFYRVSHKRYLNNLLQKNTDFISELDENILINTVSLNSSFVDFNALCNKTLRVLQCDEDYENKTISVYDDIPSERNCTEELVTEGFAEPHAAQNEDFNSSTGSATTKYNACNLLDSVNRSGSEELVIQENISDNLSSGSTILDSIITYDSSQDNVSSSII